MLKQSGVAECNAAKGFMNNSCYIETLKPKNICGMLVA